jgi:hypothetical protein
MGFTSVVRISTIIVSLPSDFFSPNFKHSRQQIVILSAVAARFFSSGGARRRGHEVEESLFNPQLQRDPSLLLRMTN